MRTCPSFPSQKTLNQLGMDNLGVQGTLHRLPPATSPSLRRSTKSRAPTPPASAQTSGSPRAPQRLPGLPPVAMEQKENMTDRDLTLTVVLPGGVERTTVVHGSKPMMDLLVMLCAKYRLNPSSHTVELISTNQNRIKFKPNTLIGALEAEKILLKPKGADKNKAMGPQVPEATVRLIINYKRAQKTILRVNPQVPLKELLPSICEKCECESQATVLLRDVLSAEPLDLSKSLNDFGLREVYAKESKGNNASKDCLILQERNYSPQSKGNMPKEKENKGLFRMFRRSKKRLERTTAASAPASPMVSKQSPTMTSTSGPAYTSNTMPADVPKKRRAPLPPMMMSQSVPSGLDSHRVEALSDDSQMLSGSSCSGSPETSTKRIKRKAPQPPCTAAPGSPRQDDSVNGRTISQSTLEEIHELDEMLSPPIRSSSPVSGLPAASVDCGKADLSSDSADCDMRSSLQSLHTGEDHSGDLSSDGKLVGESGTSQHCAEQTLNTEEADIPQMGCTETQASLAEQRNIQISLSSENGLVPHEDGEQSPARLHNDQQPRTQSSTPPKQERGAQDSGASDQLNVSAVFWDELKKADLSVDAHSVHEEESQIAFSSTTEPEAAEATKLKKDMATSTEELRFSDRWTAPATKGAPIYAKEPTSRPKLSDEFPRGYTPKVGLTTFTVVPQKTLKKVRLFEVEVTLEAPSAVEKRESTASPPEAGKHRMAPGQKQLMESCAPTPSHDSCENNMSMINDGGGHSNVDSTQPDLVPPVVPVGVGKGYEPSLTFDGGIKAGPALQIKGKKIPPATKPKPASFRLPQHIRTPGYPVTSATVSNVSASPDGAPGQQGKKLPREQPAENFSLSSPPSRLPAERWEEEGAGRSPQEVGKTQEDPSPEITRRAGALAKQPLPGLSLEKLRSFAAPKPYSPANPSRFALAVSSAVRRSQSLTQGPGTCVGCSKPSYILPAQDFKEPSRGLEMEIWDSEGGRESVPREALPGGQGSGSALPAALMDTSRHGEECDGD
ncbi:cordon-bleu protein-like 1b isoform X2 [Brienomyrus brachyistius]|uniref:cordon-bleu protein-like 1b isoform X2 n=1 Tax=Brienomyrus brachyistius TaxID=42636 RepID=UPI0020B2CC84|nr:cordon-bleu protein-like 1b isoform X2 [Brienomyrus brachyistius]